ncbi:MAG TPA: carboxymuconolactone decarboxylase family protein [Candidatus Kapabacteria bacterium]|jgi:4-carboxymuconolactone decarboxylase|nr:carboxymuconolactone decarboxylase family protein [Candidatus Kapabacteria bacterium]
MDHRTHTLVRLSALAARYDYREKLREAIVEARSSASVRREEVYECFLQLYLFAGFPAALEAMRALRKSWPSETDDEMQAGIQMFDYPEFLDRGQKLYEQIYSKNAEVVRKEMLKLSPELAVWAVVEGYGKTLSRPGLDATTRELCIIALLVQLGWERQLFSHILGAKNTGATAEAIREAMIIGAMDDAKKQERALELLARA